MTPIPGVEAAVETPPPQINPALTKTVILTTVADADIIVGRPAASKADPVIDPSGLEGSTKDFPPVPREIYLCYSKALVQDPKRRCVRPYINAKCLYCKGLRKPYILMPPAYKAELTRVQGLGREAHLSGDLESFNKALGAAAVLPTLLYFKSESLRLLWESHQTIRLLNRNILRIANMLTQSQGLPPFSDEEEEDIIKGFYGGKVAE
ncbi:hypothetical protein DTO212C5_2554 [Paecilomyces variotii]|nr:hypothetical protein DTO212C5_2554 [Paecilomyces variotii]